MISLAKRSINITLAVIALTLLLPLFLILAVLIKLSSPGPVFFRQVRVGMNRNEFTMIKFRTMMTSAEQKGPQVTSLGDSRVTFIGNILRRTKLDELPVLLNVMKGNMNLVGPRPEVPRYVKHYRPEWESAFSVKPGITDLATLQFRDEESCLINASDREQAYIDVVIPIKMKLALEYVAIQSLWFDFKLLFLTVWAITLGRIFAKPDNHLAKIAAEKIIAYNSQHQS